MDIKFKKIIFPNEKGKSKNDIKGINPRIKKKKGNINCSASALHRTPLG